MSADVAQSETGPMPLLEVERLTMRFGGLIAIDDVSFAANDREITAIIGPNGAGKTTCFNVLTGRYKPNRGQVVLAGEDITGLPPRTIARKGVARSFQNMNLFDDFTALENVVLALPEVRGIGLNMVHDLTRDSASMDRAASVLARVGLRGREHAVARDLAYGQRRALEIGIAVAAEPRLLFLDEPTSGLGSDATRALAGLIEELRSSVTIVVIEHDMGFLFGLADYIFVVHWGQIISQGTPAELRANEWVKRSNLGELA